MKTLKKITALISILTVIFTVTLSASNINSKDEAYIDDIPFDTKKVFDEIMNERNLEAFKLEEETYIDDIPFDTECVTIDCRYQQAISIDFHFEEEAYINDIPFNTACVATNCLYQRALKVEFNFDEEPYIDDIPFDTYSMMGKKEYTSLASKE